MNAKKREQIKQMMAEFKRLKEKKKERGRKEAREGS